jgi:hypothetical protein
MDEERRRRCGGVRDCVMDTLHGKAPLEEIRAEDLWG